MSEWPRYPLDKLTSKIGTGSTPRGGARIYRDAGVPLIRSMNVHTLEIVEEGMAYLGPAQASRLSAVEVKPGDVLLNITGASIGRVALATERWAGARVNQHVCIIRSNGALDPIFLAHYLASPEVQAWISQENYGSTREALTKAALSKLMIPAPPLGEQRRIVEKLRSMLGALRCAREKLETAAHRLDVYKTAVLDTAFQGEWKQVCASTLFDEGPSNGFSPRTAANGVGPLTLKLSATTSGTLKLGEHTTKRLIRPIADNSKHWLRSGDVLIQRANTIQYVGSTAIYDGPENTYIYPDLMMRVRIHDKVKREYFWRYMNSTAARSWLRSRASGTSGSMPKITGELLRSLPLPLPPHENMIAIVGRIRTALTTADAKMMEVRKSLEKVSALEEMTLSKAFSGSFVPSAPSDLSVEAVLATLTEDAITNTQRASRLSMKTNNAHLLLRAVEAASDEGVGFDEIRHALDLDYEGLKEAVFSAISSGQIRQFFDKGSRCMRFRKGEPQ